MPRLSDYRVVTFDCYGTLIDWETGIWDALQPLIMHNRRNDIRRREALAAFAKIEAHHQSVACDLPYPELLARVHRSIAERLELETNEELDSAFGGSVEYWPAFADSADALRALKNHYRLVILSNVNRAGFAASNRKLGVTFDAIYTAEDVGAYKPSNANFEYLLAHLQSDFGFEKKDILHTAQSLRHDHVPAKRFGLANAWIDRQKLSQGGDWGATDKVEEPCDTDFLFFTMREMVEAVKSDADR
ncbi:haloacid dehalogenase type II [Thioalkalivibrio sp. HK1]|uniref:haloacid dehalogenase type II n=1 Tax=Thioalkalivibrio sp. HK1 TaxID=1469245 RepID=UPI00047278C2|nr:haloacid dehalogenase type II [Thioalkalivibrio sp. HK1]